MGGAVERVLDFGFTRRTATIVVPYGHNTQ